jgi:hypothetical protein
LKSASLHRSEGIRRIYCLRNGNTEATNSNKFVKGLQNPYPKRGRRVEGLAKTGLCLSFFVKFVTNLTR